MNTIDYPALMENRKNIYQFLGRLFRREVDAETLEVVKGLTLEGSYDFTDGLRMMQNAIEASEDPITDFAVDYARIFLGAGIAKGQVAYPFESVYTSRDGLVMQDAYEQVLGIYRGHNLGKMDKDLYEDHLGLELEFMGFLCGKTKEALEHDDEESVSALLDEQADFLKTHLLNWVPKCLADVAACPGTDFYRGLGKMTGAFLQAESEMLLLTE